MKVEERKAIPGRGHSTCKSNYLTTVPQAWEIICSNTMRTNICSWNELIYFDRLHLFSHQGYPESKRMFIGIAAWYRKVERNKGRRGKRIEKERKTEQAERHRKILLVLPQLFIFTSNHEKKFLAPALISFIMKWKKNVQVKIKYNRNCVSWICFSFLS